jgi:phenylacetaldehyde dehydrogenase
VFIPKFETVVDPQVLEFIRPQNLKMLINGQFVDSVSGETFVTVDPATGRKIADVPKADARDVDLAVKAARQALEHPSWCHMLPADRQLLLLRLADLIEKNGEKIAQLETLDQGQLIDVARFVQVEMAVDFIRYMAGWATKLEGSALELSVREPIGAGIRYQA